VNVIVVKVGGSLFDHPRLGAGLSIYLESLAPAEVMLIPGGGEAVDAVRKLDQVHRLGEENSHWLALQAMSVTAEFIRRVIDLSVFGSRVSVPDCLAFAWNDLGRNGELPHSWDAASDSIAARIAVIHCAERLILLKSIEIPTTTSWSEAAERGLVDRYFPTVLAAASCPVETVDFRSYLNSVQGKKV
jgi:aspartokinase-like uncharacterized kinase